MRMISAGVSITNYSDIKSKYIMTEIVEIPSSKYMYGITLQNSMENDYVF